MKRNPIHGNDMQRTSTPQDPMQGGLMPCVCGANHPDTVTRTVIRRGMAGQTLQAWLREGGYKRVLFVADIHTAAAARSLMASVGCVGEAPDIGADIWVYNDENLTPDEAAVGRLWLATGQAAYAALVSVGSGTLNDITRYVSFRLGLPYFVVATAASMDGYTSSVAPLTVGGLKYTYPAHAPLGVMGDADILETAPPCMTAAGYGDVMGKWTSTHDWELEHMITGEPYCDRLAQAMRAVAADCLPAAPGQPEAVLAALLRSGLIMQEAGHSRPASGSEHHLSHFWEMTALLRGQAPALHGAKVGVATLIVLRVNEALLQETVDWERAYQAAKHFDEGLWRDALYRVYGRAADGVLAQWPAENAATRARTLDAVRVKWETIKARIRRNLPDYQTVEAGLRRMGCPLTPADVHMNRDDVYNGVRYAQYVRPRFTTWRLAELLGVLPAYAERLSSLT